MRPDKYPLPWCKALDAPYWSINLYLILNIEGWREWQTGKPMDSIIPEIDRIVAQSVFT